MNKMNKDIHVYCTHCVHFKVTKCNEYDYMPKCKYENECCLEDCEDSRPLNERPHYEEMINFKQDFNK